MPDFMVELQNIASGSATNPFETPGGTLQPWRFRRCPYPRGLYTILARHDGAAKGVEWSVAIGTTEVLQRSTMSAGGTDGVFPTPAGANSAPVVQFVANAGDEIVPTVFETGAVATTDVMIWANVEPA